MLGEQWHPIKVDRVNRSVSPDGGTDITKEATEAIAQENGVKIQRIRWLSKPSLSVVVWLAEHQEAEMLSAQGRMDLGEKWHTPRHTYDDRDLRDASSVTNTDTWRRDVRLARSYAASAHKRATGHRNAPHPGPDVQRARGRMQPQIEHAHVIWSYCDDSIQSNIMVRALRVLQANLRKSSMAQHSLMNDEGLRNYGLLMISEPACFTDDDGKTVAPPSHHAKWTQILPTRSNREARFPIRSLIYVHDSIRAQVVPVASSDIVAVRFRVEDRPILAITVYIPPTDQDALSRTMELVRETINERGRGHELVIVGDFNRHDQLSGGDEVGATARQGEAQEILDLMTDLNLQLLLPRGTKTYESEQGDSTIDLILTSQGLA
jgi:Endonuclease-reverse transcriptase